MISRLICVLLISMTCVLPLGAESQTMDNAWGARPLGLGKAYIGAANDVYAPFWNPAGLSRAEGDLAAFTLAKPSARPAPLDQTNLTLGSLSLINPPQLGRGRAGFWWSHLYESDVRRENVFSLALSRALLPGAIIGNLSAGVNLKYINHEALDVAAQDRSAFSADLGLLYAPVNWFQVGAAVRDVTRPRVGEPDNAKRPAKAGGGVGLWITPNTLLAFDVAGNERDGDAEARGGLEQWLFNRAAALRAGMNAEHGTLGLSLRTGPASLDYAYNYPLDKERYDQFHAVTLRARWGGPRAPRTGRASGLRLTPDDNLTGPATLSLNEQEDEQYQQYQEEGQPKKARRLRSLKTRATLVIGPADVLQVTVKNHPELDAAVTVDSWGYIKMPYVGEIKVTGLLREELENRLEDIYAEFVINPRVTVAITEYNSRIIYIMGQVVNPGKYPMHDKMVTLRDAVIMAGMPTDRAALWRAFIIRVDDKGRRQYIHINLQRILYRGQLENNITLRPGDIVFLPMTWLDGIATMIGRIVGPIVGVGRSLATP